MGALLSRFAGALLGGWRKWALAAGAALVVAGYIGWLKWDIAAKEAALARVTAERDEAVRVAAANAQALEQLSQQAVDAIAALEAERAAFARRASRVQVIVREIERAPSTEDGPVAPVLERAIGRLYENPH